jgi:hypothetical protein
MAFLNFIYMVCGTLVGVAHNDSLFLRCKFSHFLGIKHQNFRIFQMIFQKAAHL